MALTKISGSILKDPLNLGGEVSIGGTLTYQDVTNVDSIGLGTFRNGIHVKTGTATTALVVEGDGRVTGILTVGTGSITLNQTANTINVGTALTLGHTQGLQFHTQNLHSTGFEINQINASGIITASQFKGDGSQLTGISAGTSLSGSTNNTVTTVTGANAIQGESTLTYDGNNLQNLQSGAAANLTLKATSNSFNSLILDSNRSADTQFAILDGRWNGNPVARIQYVTGSDGTNKDDGYMAFHTRTSGASLTERLRIKSNGTVNIGTNNQASGDSSSKLRVGQAAGSDVGVVVIGNADTTTPALIITNWDGAQTQNKSVIHFDNSGWGSHQIGSLAGSDGFGIYDDSVLKISINNAGMITLGTPTNTVLKAEICNAVNGHYFVSQCDDNSNGFEIYQKHGSTSTRNTFAVYANTGGGASKLSQFIISGDNNAYFRGTVSPEADNAQDMGTDAKTWRQLHYLNGYPGRGTQQITSTSNTSSSSWYDVGYSRGNMGGLDTNGVYIITLFADTWAAGGNNYSCNYTWIVGMRNQSTNQTTSNNIPLLSVTGHSTNNVLFELRTTRQASVHGADEYLQWRCTASMSAINNTNGRIMKWDIQRIGRSAP